MTFLQLYVDKLNIELASADQTQLFTTARRKTAINEAQDNFARVTGCTKRYFNLPLTTGTAEYDLESFITDYIRLAGAPSIKIVSGSTTRYIQGKDDFPRRDPEELDHTDPGWRAATAGTPNVWYLREDGGATFIGLNPAPSIKTGDVWTLIVPYVADPPDMSASTDQPFTLGAGVVSRLVVYHQALVHYAAAQLEPLRKNYSGVQRQMQLYSGYVAQFLQQQREDGRDQIGLLRGYYDEGLRQARPQDPHTFP